jgi:hypothetical protein
MSLEPQQITKLKQLLEEALELLGATPGTKHATPEKGHQIKRNKTSAEKGGPNALIAELIDEGFFKKPKEFGAIKTALEERGHYYPRTTLSPTLLGLVRAKMLRRFKEKKHWVYVA